MRELCVNEMKEVNGGNPALVIAVVIVAKKAAPYVKKGIIAIAGAIATAIGTVDGGNGAK